MATLPGLILRLTAACALTIALAALFPRAARAQASDSANSVTTSSADTSHQPAAADGHSARASGEASTDSTSAAQSDSSDKDDSESGSPSSGQYAIHAALKTFNAEPRSGDTVFEHASELFPSFCKDWQRRLHDRELNNLENVNWKDENGWKTGTYTGYSPVKTCNCKRSTGGVPIGELTYQETEYYLAGRTVEEARHAQPKQVGVVNTTEIFRWDRTKWDDGR